MYGIDVDLIYAQIPFEKIETDFDIMDNEIIQWNKDKRSILALAGQLNKIQTTPPPLHLFTRYLILNINL